MFLRRVIVAGGAAASALLTAAVVGKVGDDSNTSIGSWPPVCTGRWDRNWDRREPMSLINLSKVKGDTEEELKRQLKKYEARARRHIFLIRHGQYNLDGKTDAECVLTPLGHEQADLTGQRLAHLGYDYTKMVYSTLTRAKETSKIIGKYLKGVPTSSSDLLQEGAPIRPDPPAQWKPEFMYYEDGPRIESAFREYIHRADYEQDEDSYEILVCHDNVIRYIVCRALQVAPDAWLRMSLHHGSITELLIHHNGNVSLRSLGDAGYMPVKCLSR
ncbi:serine/threonine-protein phosphatase PGAM5, mitochondrial-like isoform X1 [Mixophyes fleayi]|uniref:serine/threonine-protein phosphatase PGAM5, mitochondrial-like isoform X1 n=1 Tax=Mixophyes fleayi TaxID=3061075 RepID=UPI003F4DA717